MKTLKDLDLDQDIIREGLIDRYAKRGESIAKLARDIGIAYSSLYGFMSGKRLSRICLLKVESQIKEWAKDDQL